MKYFKIYDTKYELHEESSQGEEDAYGYKNEIVYEEPDGEYVGFVEMEDESIIACYKSFNPIPVICISLGSIFAIVAGILLYVFVLQPKDVYMGGTPVKVGDDANSVSYNGFMALRDGNLTVDFQNGKLPCTIQVIGDGIKSDPVNVEAEEYVATVPTEFETEDAVINGKIKITTESSESEVEVVIEIPQNNTPNSTEASMEGYWDGEYIYGN